MVGVGSTVVPPGWFQPRRAGDDTDRKNTTGRPEGRPVGLRYRYGRSLAAPSGGHRETFLERSLAAPGRGPLGMRLKPHLESIRIP